jgi:hypothetical protein
MSLSGSRFRGAATPRSNRFGRCACLDRFAPRWRPARHVSLATKSGPWAASVTKETRQAKRRADEPQSPRRGRSEAQERRSRLTAARRRGPHAEPWRRDGLRCRASRHTGRDVIARRVAASARRHPLTGDRASACGPPRRNDCRPSSGTSWPSPRQSR